MSAFTIQAQLMGAATKVDGGLSLRFATNELQPDEAVSIMEMARQAGWLLFSPNPIQEDEIPDAVAVEGKTPSQRLRAVMFVYWKNNVNFGDFDQFYRTQVEQIIDRYKQKISS